MRDILNKLWEGKSLEAAEYLELIRGRQELREEAAAMACRLRQRYYGDRVFIRGLIEFTNYCKNNCYYCGIRAGNVHAERYRLSKEEILSCADEGYELGFRTFVLQGGEDPAWTPEAVEQLVRQLKEAHPDAAVTLSVGEHTRETYRRWKEAGADRYLLRHETINKAHYESLHPEGMDHGNRLRCLRDLKELGYQVGAGFMVGSPGQREEDLAEELCFLREFRPHMVGIGPFIPHQDTPFAQYPAGQAELTLFLLSLIRLTLPRVLLPATTALGTVDAEGRERGILAGANVVMPNLSPVGVRKKYMLYDHKICTGEEAAQCIECLKARIRTTGCEIVTDRGDHVSLREETGHQREEEK